MKWALLGAAVVIVLVFVFGVLPLQREYNHPDPHLICGPNLVAACHK